MALTSIATSTISPAKQLYRRQDDDLSRQIAEADREIEDILQKAQELSESKKRIEQRRERLSNERNAARQALRSLEDSE